MTQKKERLSWKFRREISMKGFFESNYFNAIGHPFPAVCIRTSTERPEALDKGNFILSGIDTAGLLQSVELAVGMNRAGDFGVPVPDYMDLNVSAKVVKIIQSYVGVVDQFVWRKQQAAY